MKLSERSWKYIAIGILTAMFALYASLKAQTSESFMIPLTLSAAMTTEEAHNTGLDRLKDKQKMAFDQWLSAMDGSQHTVPAKRNCHCRFSFRIAGWVISFGVFELVGEALMEDKCSTCQVNRGTMRCVSCSVPLCGDANCSDACEGKCCEKRFCLTCAVDPKNENCCNYCIVRSLLSKELAA